MSYPTTGGLTAHRANLSANPICFSQDKERAITNWMKHCWAFVKIHSPLKKSQADSILREMAELVFDAQGGQPLFQFNMGSTGLPTAWNRPQDGDKDYIRYEVGHIHPQLEGGESNPENLTFQSARCNQHIQSSLDIDEVLEYFQDNEVVLQRMNSLRELHHSTHWNYLKSQLKLDS
jgi:hypothetical protein